MLKKQVKGFKKVKKVIKIKNGNKREDKMLELKSSLDESGSGEEDSVAGDSDVPAFAKKQSRFEDEFSIKKWYEEFPDTLTEQSPLDDAQRDALRKEAGALFQEEVKTNAGRAPKTIPRSDYNWIKTVIAKGTVNDKIAAYVLLIQDDPVVNMTYLKTMVSMSKVGKKKECFMAMDTLVEVFLDVLLPPNRKLKYFVQQPLSMVDKVVKGGADSRRRLLLLWFFEDQLKSIYTAFIQALNEAAHDTVEANKERVVVFMHKMLQGHPEQEAALLSNIVNKLGDPSHKIGSKVIYTLTKLLDRHPLMKIIVMEEVEKVIFRPNMSKRAQYYSICFLGQFTFDSSDSTLASRLISIYFALFKACIKTGEIDTRMMSALLTGVSRAFPFAKSECGTLTEHINTVYKVVHLSSANVAIHALSLLYLVVGESLTDRFMTVLYKKIGEPGMFNAAHHAMFLSIIFKAIRRDPDSGRVCAFIKRLLQVAVHLAVPLVCGILMLISQVVQSRKKFSLRMEQEAIASVKLPSGDDDDDDDGEEHYSDHVNAADLQIIMEKVKTEKESEDSEIKVEPSEIVVKEEAGGSSWYHAAMKPAQGAPNSQDYDPYQRNPLHANGDKALPVELKQLSRHFHPTVALFASNIIEGSKISYSGDPLQDFTLIRFLDKFVFKNPKKIKDSDEQLTTFARFGRKKYYASVGLKRLRVNTEEYLKNDEKIIPVDETFMYKYLKQRTVKKKVKKEEMDEESDVESVDDEEFDDILRKVSRGQKDDLDFMREIGSLPAQKHGAAQVEDDDDSSGDDEDGGEASDDAEDIEDLPEDDDDLSDLGSNAEDFDGDEADEWSDDADLDSDLDDAPPPKNKKETKPGRKVKTSGGLFAAAEEFAELLENDQYQAGSSAALSNKDNAAVKQLKWETSRDRWVKGKGKFKRSKSFSQAKGKAGPQPQGNKRKGSRQGHDKAPLKKRKPSRT